MNSCEAWLSPCTLHATASDPKASCSLSSRAAHRKFNSAGRTIRFAHVGALSQLDDIGGSDDGRCAFASERLVSSCALTPSTSTLGSFSFMAVPTAQQPFFAPYRPSLFDWLRAAVHRPSLNHSSPALRRPPLSGRNHRDDSPPSPQQPCPRPHLLLLLPSRLRRCGQLTHARSRPDDANRPRVQPQHFCNG